MTVDSYPLAEPGAAASQASLKLVTAAGEFESAYQEKLQAYAPNLEIKKCRSKEEFRQEVADANIVFGGLSREDFRAARQLRWVQYSAAGVDEVLYPEFVESSVVLTNMQRMFSPTISESVIGMLISLTRRLHDYALLTREQKWNPLSGLHDITGMTMGIVGMGGIGTDTAYRAHYGFQMRILARTPSPCRSPHLWRNSTRPNGSPRWSRKLTCWSAPRPTLPSLITCSMMRYSI